MATVIESYRTRPVENHVGEESRGDDVGGKGNEALGALVDVAQVLFRLAAD